jgi:hypothetical protein
VAWRVVRGYGSITAEVTSAQMFCEILLAEWLGPRPGQGTRTDLDDLSHAISAVEGLIPQPRISELQRLWRWTQKRPTVRVGRWWWRAIVN